MSRGEIRGRESGQALVLIVLAVVGLLGLTALAVDGAHVFAQRRQAQNAADTAAFAAALERINGGAPGDGWTQALARAASNNFADAQNDPGVNNSAPVDVIVSYPPTAPCPGDSSSAYYLSSTAAPPYSYLTGHARDYFVQVRINAQIPTFFAKVVGVSTLPIHVCAVAKAVPPFSAPMGGDNGIVALGDVCNAIRSLGNGQTTVTGGGLFSNSGAPTNPSGGNCYSVNGGGSGAMVVDSATMYGCLDPGDLSGGYLVFGAAGYTCGASQIAYPPPTPDIGISCADLPVGTKTGTTAHPGQWSHALGNLGGNQVFPPSGVNKVDPGVYCITGHFTLNNTDTLTGTGGVTFILDGDLTWSAQATINLIPTATGKLAGLLIYRPLNYANGSCDGSATLPGSNGCQTLKINGGASSTWSGTIYAPDSLCHLNGESTSFTPNAQAICYTVELEGTQNWTMTYNGATNWDFPYPPSTNLDR